MPTDPNTSETLERDAEWAPREGGAAGAAVRLRPFPLTVVCLVYMLFAGVVTGWVSTGDTSHWPFPAPPVVLFLVATWLGVTGYGGWTGRVWSRASALALHLGTPLVIGSLIVLDMLQVRPLGVPYELPSVAVKMAVHAGLFVYWWRDARLLSFLSNPVQDRSHGVAAS